MTVMTRQAVIEVALSLLDTPYVWGGEDPVCGFDCSGFINYVFYVVYGGAVFPVSTNNKGQIIRLTASQQYSRCYDRDWLLPFEEALDGDIVWRNDKGHVGISYLLFKVIHASGRLCSDGELPTVPSECRQDIFDKQRLCGKYKKVVITPLNGFGQVLPKICRPQP